MALVRRRHYNRITNAGFRSIIILNIVRIEVAFVGIMKFDPDRLKEPLDTLAGGGVDIESIPLWARHFCPRPHAR